MTSPRTFRLLVLAVVVAVMVVGVVGAHGTNSNQRQAKEFLEMFNAQAQGMMPAVQQKIWNYKTNITAENQQAAVDAGVQKALWRQNMSRLAAKFNTEDFPPDMQRQFFKIKDIGTAALDDVDKLKQLKELQAEMSTIYSTAKVCLEENNCLSLEPDIIRLFATSRDENLLRRLWIGWRAASGKKMRQLYPQFVSLTNEAVRELGYEDTGAYWKSKYETATFEKDIAALFEELLPFYRQLHAFVRHRLKEQYGEEVFPSSGHIPAHLLGNVWAQKWHTLQDLLMPFPNKAILDVTEQLVQQNYTARKIFEVADDFFTSLGLEPMPQTFWEKSMLEKPDDGREVVCHASAWDFLNGVDFRIKQCTEPTMEHFITVHHEMGHVEYYLLYKHLPVIFRRGANPGFHEAVGDTISLSVQTPRHLHQIGLLPSVQEDTESELNFLMAMSLQKIAFLPFGYLIDQWRWSVFRGDTTPDNYTQAWWDLRCHLQGVSPPVARTEADFDPGAKFHISGNSPYIRYFVRNVIQFQFQEALCNSAGHQGPLHTCDIYNSTEAGHKLRAMLSKGSSEVWTVPFQALTGQTKMSAQPLIQYFQPLMDYLQQYNKDHDVKVGWEEGCPSTSSAGQVTFNALLLSMILAMVFSPWSPLKVHCPLSG